MKESVKLWLGEQMAGLDDATLGDIYSEYAETAGKLYAELSEKRAAGASFDDVDRVAHTLKGNALMVGDQALFEAVQAWRLVGDQALFEAVQAWRGAIREGGLAAGDPLWDAIGTEVAAIRAGE